MTEEVVHNCAEQVADERLEKAVEWFLRARSEEARAEDLVELQRWMESDPQNALAYQQTLATWNTLGAHASAPEIIVGRRDALENSRRAVRYRWSAPPLSRLRWAAAAVLVVIVAGSWWFLSQRAGVYATARGERRTVTLEDGSVVTLDAQSRVRTEYTDRERRVTLEEGEARFSVMKDPLRPFRVQAREQTVVALGTQFDVELAAGAVVVTLIDGRVAVAGVDRQSLSQVGARDPPGPEEATGLGGATSPHRTGHADDHAHEGRASERIVELQAGQELRVGGDGRATLVANVNLDRATAWLQGKLFFDNEPLADAVARINRYARRAIVIDPSVAQMRISGVFNAGDADAFVEAVTLYLPVQIGMSSEREVQLTARK